MHFTSVFKPSKLSHVVALVCGSRPPPLAAGAISALQFQAVRLACARHELRLPDGARAGFFLGDGEPPHMNRLYPGSLNHSLFHPLSCLSPVELPLG